MNFLQDGVLSLKGLQPLAQGTHRKVYVHPELPGTVIKVMLSNDEKPAAVGMQLFKRRLKDQLMPKLHYNFLYREYMTYLDIKIQQNMRGDRQKPPIAELRGMIDTDEGVGMLAESVELASGELGHSISYLFRQKQLHLYLPQLNQFVRELFDWNIRINDLNEGNVVLGCYQNKMRFVIIDGLGDSNLIPVKRWFGVLNRRSLQKRLRCIAKRVNLHWNSELLEFQTLDTQ